MSRTMHISSIALACLACAVHCRRVPTVTMERETSPRDFASFLLALQPGGRLSSRPLQQPMNALSIAAQQTSAIASRRNAQEKLRTSVVRMQKKQPDLAAGEVEEVPFELRLPLGDVITYTGLAVLVYGLISFFVNSGESDVLQIIAFVYGIPAAVGGLALKYAEMPPVPLDTNPQAQAARESKANPSLKKIISDTTRFTYGDGHLEPALKALKLSGSLGPPTLIRLSESVTEKDQYRLTLRFESPNTAYNIWKDRANRFGRFFGPNVRAELFADVANKVVGLSLVTMAEGEDDKPYEILDDGSREPILSGSEKAALEEKKAKEAEQGETNVEEEVAA